MAKAMTKKEITFKFFKENPKVLDDSSRKKYINQLGISKSTYANYKWEYKMLHPEMVEKKEIQECDMNYKGRKREKFIFDDSGLFGYVQ